MSGRSRGIGRIIAMLITFWYFFNNMVLKRKGGTDLGSEKNHLLCLRCNLREKGGDG